jgi:hypothetical protein
MSDEELVKALRNFDDGATPTHEAADRIEQLGKACAEWAEVSQSNYQRAKVAETKLAECEARLGKAVEALRVLMATAYADDHIGWQDALEEARDVTELVGAAKALMARWPTDQHSASPLYEEAQRLRAAVAKMKGRPRG